MATEQQFIDRIRRKVFDFDEPRKYDVNYYQDALAFALSKLSFDLDEAYSYPELVPNNREFLVVKLGTIEMCHVRAGSSLNDGDPASEGEAVVSKLDVPDLKIETNDEGPAERAEAWLRMAKDLQDEYDGEIKHIGGTATAAQIQTDYLNVHSYKTGGLANRRLDRGLPAVTVGGVVNGLNVSLSWSVLYHPEFWGYEIHRSSDGFVSSDVCIGTVYDNHDVAYTDIVSAGTYQYRVYTVNPNDIKIPSNTLEVVVT